MPVADMNLTEAGRAPDPMPTGRSGPGRDPIQVPARRHIPALPKKDGALSRSAGARPPVTVVPSQEPGRDGLPRARNGTESGKETRAHCATDRFYWEIRKMMVPQKGLEPPTHALRMRCSTS